MVPCLLRRAVAASVVVSAFAAAACSGDDQATTTTTTTAGAEATSTTVAPATDGYAVGRRVAELVDGSRPSAADPSRDVPAEPDRTLPLLVLYPATGTPTSPTEPVDDAPVADGAFPLVVFSHGVGSDGPRYEERLREWAAAGYVVVAPTYPRTSEPGAPITDYVNQPADVSFVIDQLTNLPDDDSLAGHIDDEHIAVAGHSLGAITSIGVTLASCVADPDVDALVELSGIRLPFGSDCDVNLQNTAPVLAIHADDDDTVPVGGSDGLVKDLTGRADYLRFHGGGHTDYLIDDGPLLDTVIVAFLDDVLKGDDTGLPAAREAAKAAGHATFTERSAPG